MPIWTMAREPVVVVLVEYMKTPATQEVQLTVRLKTGFLRESTQATNSWTSEKNEFRI